MSQVCMLTTTDNPYNPFDDFVKWYDYDVTLGHSCCELLSRFCFTADSFTEEENNAEIERAIDEIVANDLGGLYVKAVREFDDEDQRYG